MPDFKPNFQAIRLLTLRNIFKRRVCLWLCFYTGWVAGLWSGAVQHGTHAGRLHVQSKEDGLSSGPGTERKQSQPQSQPEPQPGQPQPTWTHGAALRSQLPTTCKWKKTWITLWKSEFKEESFYFLVNYSFNFQGMHEMIKCVSWMQCELLWKKAFVNCINVHYCSKGLEQ